MSDHNQHNEFAEESALGNIYDAKLVKRLLWLMRPYRWHIALAIVVLIVVTAFELVLPYITKEAIDRYIKVSGRKMVTTQEIPGAFRLAGDTVLVDVARLGREQQYRAGSWEKQGRLERASYYYFVPDGSDQTKRAVEVTKGNRTLFQQYGDLYLIEYDHLKKLPPDKIAVLRQRDIKGVLNFGLLFLGLLVISFGLNFVQIILVQLVGQRFMHSLRERIFAKLQSIDMSFFDRNPVGRLVTRATNDVDAINEAFVSVFAQLFRDVLLVLALMAMMLLLDVKLSLVAYLTIPLIAVWTIFFRIKARDIYRNIRVRLARLNATLQENLSGIRVIQIFQREKENIRRFGEINDQYLRASLQEVLVMSFFRPMVEIISAVGLALIIYYGGGKVIASNLSLGTLVAFTTYLRMFFRPIQELTESYTVLQSAMASSERVFQLLDEPSTISLAEKPVDIGRPRGEIEFKDVVFEYVPGEPVLKNVSFKVSPGERIAFVGATGSGKTTIINLIARLYDIKSGQILLDGVDIRKMDIQKLRSSLGVVMQDVFLFSGDIKGNIRLNKPLSDQEVVDISRQVHADTFIERFPGQYGEEVKERGVTLSVGERQLLSFARALAFDPPVLVLDEATANIDTPTEKLIQDALAKLMQGRTSIVIAHRLSTIKHVDRIYVIHKGEIRESGSHQELLKKRGLYHSLYQLQLGGESN
ncbi:MAG: ABC transporter ATP-binding protein [Candidatus Edwardsbacteria bacterium]|nr:ABC transporter ATP-binding protein [Candidatus Edwardsbacteria bacterium]